MNKLNVPNRLTLLRILLVPVFVASCFLEAWLPWYRVLATAIFLIAALTDLVDGKIARSRGLVTNFGKLIDPMADKLLFCSAFIMLTWLHQLSPILCILLIGREFVVSGFRLVTASSGTVIAASKLGKAKTAVQAVAIVAMLLENPIFSRWSVPFDQIAMLVATALSVWSAVDYIWKNRKAVSWE